MKAKINKALDYNKLLEAQAEGKQLKKVLKSHIITGIKYDGNYVVIRVGNQLVTFTTSGGLNYTHLDGAAVPFYTAKDGVYLAERIHGEGKLGARDRCNLKGPKSAQTSEGHNYKVFDYLTLEEYDRGNSYVPYRQRLMRLWESGLPKHMFAFTKPIYDKGKLEFYLKSVVNDGYEGLMLMDPEWCWEDTQSRKIPFCKYKKRPTADLLCVGITEGEGKYVGMVGSLILKDSKGRTVNVGSGLSDEQRAEDNHIGKVWEIEYERIATTYIQPTIVRERDDKTVEEID